MMSGDRKKATAIGAMVHFVVMGTVVFGLAYAALFTPFDHDAWWVGLAIGVVHGLVVGVVAMPMMPKMHPRMEDDTHYLSGGETVTEGAGGLRIAGAGPPR